MEGIVVDTNVFVAAGFNPRSASARVLAAVRDERLHLIWNQSTRHEIEMILRRIPRLDWEEVANLFQPKREFGKRSVRSVCRPAPIGAMIGGWRHQQNKCPQAA
jgi:hypothetical protein